jgi:hypothetical protein
MPDPLRALSNPAIAPNAVDLGQAARRFNR